MARFLALPLLAFPLTVFLAGAPAAPEVFAELARSLAGGEYRV